MKKGVTLERVAQLEQARQELAKRRQSAHSREDAAKMRVSETDPDSRVMKGCDGGYRPSYNVQVATDEQAGVTAIGTSMIGEFGCLRFRT